MTIPDNDVLDEPVAESSKRAVPEIKGEEDIPFPSDSANSSPRPERKPIDKKLGKTDDLTKFRFETGRTVLYIAMSAMAIMVLLDLTVTHYWEIERDMIESAFEAFKLITMTVLGYIFGSNGSNGSDASN